MHRLEVINSVIREKGRDLTYIEIGVRNGKCFLFTEATRRVAIDPVFKIEKRTYWNAYKNKPWQRLRDSFYPVTSDEFFRSQCGLLRKRKPSVVFIDGLHTYDQALRDVQNSLEVMDNNGVIIMHDCNPNSPSSAYPAASFDEARALNLPGWNNVWCGDVWKVIIHLRTLPDLEVFVLNTDLGLGIVRKKTGARPALSMSVKGIAGMDYKNLEAGREKLLNLRPVSYLQEFLTSLS